MLERLWNTTFIIMADKRYECVDNDFFLKESLKNRMKDQCPNINGRKGNDIFFPLLF